MYFDSNKNCFLEKHVCLKLMQTEITPVISIEGKTKSGGSAKIDIAEPLNSNFGGINQSVEKRIPLIKCPDPDAYIDAIFYYELLDGEQGNPDMRYSIPKTQCYEFIDARFQYLKTIVSFLIQDPIISSSAHTSQKAAPYHRQDGNARSQNALKEIYVAVKFSSSQPPVQYATTNDRRIEFSFEDNHPDLRAESHRN